MSDLGPHSMKAWMSKTQRRLAVVERRGKALTRHAPKVEVQVDSADRSATTAWTLGPTFAEIGGLQPSSKLKLSYNIPMRNSDTGWGGGYIEPQVRFDGNAWRSLGSSGYDGGVMHDGATSIGSYGQVILIDPDIDTEFAVQFRFYFCSYSGTVLWNGSHDINKVSGTVGQMPGANFLQHYAHIIVEEIPA